MPELEDAFRNGYWEQLVHPIDKALSHQKAIVVNTATEEKIRLGQPVTVEDSSGNDQNENTKKKYCRAYSLDGRFLAVLESTTDGNTWHPKKVLV